MGFFVTIVVVFVVVVAVVVVVHKDELILPLQLFQRWKFTQIYNPPFRLGVSTGLSVIRASGSRVSTIKHLATMFIF